MRDEMANMVWGIETVVPDAERRRAAAASPRAISHIICRRCSTPRGAPPPPIEWQADVRYDIMTTVPEHWIPFVPEHVAGDNRQIQLRRAAMPRSSQRSGAHVRARAAAHDAPARRASTGSSPTACTRKRSRAPARTCCSPSSARAGPTARVFMWLGVRKQTGRGEGHSGLAFDRIVPTSQP